LLQGARPAAPGGLCHALPPITAPQPCPEHCNGLCELDRLFSGGRASFQAEVEEKRMATILEKVPQLIAGATFLVLLLAVTHEWSYFDVVGHQFQSLMYATDYLVSALSWLPPIFISSLGLALIWLAASRSAGGRSREELLASSKSYRVIEVALIKPLLGLLIALAGFLGVLVLYSNPYALTPLIVLSSFLWISFLVWMKRSDTFGQYLTFEGLLFAWLVPLFVMFSFLEGRLQGYRSLTEPQNIHILKLKEPPNEERVSVLRILSVGIIAREPTARNVSFYRWENIVALTLDAAPLDVRPLSCRLWKTLCPKS
jgi:hypothetical protein